MFKKRFALLLVLVMAFSTFTLAHAANKTDTAGEIAYQHLSHISDEIGSRVTGSPGCLKAKEYISNKFKNIKYKVTLQDFTFIQGSETYASTNIIAVKPGKSKKQIILGGHYDSVSMGRGADDNASGIAVMLEVAQWLKNMKTPYTIKFIAFGAEENGKKGSYYFTSQMTQKEIDNTVLMINLDSLAVGDKMYVYGDGSNGWFRDQALKTAQKLGLAIETNPGLNPDYPAGTTGDWSDHFPFKQKGIPYLSFESTNWELGELDGYTQTVKDGEIWHTTNDTIAYIEANYPGRIQEHLNAFVKVLEEVLKTSWNSTPRR